MSEEEARGDDQADQLVSESPSVEVGKGVEEPLPQLAEVDDDLRSIIMMAGDAAMAKVRADLKGEDDSPDSGD